MRPATEYENCNSLGLMGDAAYFFKMRPRWALLIYIVLVVFGAALLAPWLYNLAHASAGAFLKMEDKPLGFFVINAMLMLAPGGETFP